ncbi:hypothetical protein ACFYZJ_31270 [Streptomyces sp. NPDC001848]|uniref:hypothetical protein n=1 Tax=Streptomyces sp. NPDC001848 TaxID=3364618 RepID=UPI0036AFC8E9
MSQASVDRSSTLDPGAQQIERQDVQTPPARVRRSLQNGAVDLEAEIVGTTGVTAGLGHHPAR